MQEIERLRINLGVRKDCVRAWRDYRSRRGKQWECGKDYLDALEARHRQGHTFDWGGWFERKIGGG